MLKLWSFGLEFCLNFPRHCQTLQKDRSISNLKNNYEKNSEQRYRKCHQRSCSPSGRHFSIFRIQRFQQSSQSSYYSAFHLDFFSFYHALRNYHKIAGIYINLHVHQKDLVVLSMAVQNLYKWNRQLRLATGTKKKGRKREHIFPLFKIQILEIYLTIRGGSRKKIAKKIIPREKKSISFHCSNFKF